MRKSIVLFPLLLLALLSACGNDSTTVTSYQCPMECEGKKTYSKPGICPVCEMDLEGIESN